MALEMDGEIGLKGYTTETNIEVKTSFVGWHNWPEAPKDVGFLKNKHRHVFNVAVVLPVNHDNRHLEFFLVKAEIDDYINTEFPTNNIGIKTLGHLSCEMLCKMIGNQMLGLFSPVFLKVTVQEDDENAANTLFLKTKVGD